MLAYILLFLVLIPYKVYVYILYMYISRAEVRWGPSVSKIVVRLGDSMTIYFGHLDAGVRITG